MVKTKVCPICKKEFAGKAALRQHMEMKHSQKNADAVARRTVNRPKRAAARRVAKARSESGVDILSTRTVNASSIAGTVLFALTLAVEDLVDTRFAAMAKLWSRWRPLKMVLEVIPSAGTTASGSYVLGWVGDPDYQLGSGDRAIRVVASMVPSMESHISQRVKFSIPCEALQKWYLVDATVDGEKSHGAVYGVLSSAIGNLTSDSKVSFSIRLAWTVEFSSPKLPVEESIDTIYAEDDYAPYFTDSISDWASGKMLTLKERAGGNAVPFIGAKPGVVYKIDSKAKLVYYKDATNKTTLSYGVRIPNYYSAALAVFADESNAKKFALSGDSSVCLPYFAAGDYVTPSNPAWTAVSTQVALYRNPAFTLQQAGMESRIHELEKKLDRLLLMTDEMADSREGFQLIGHSDRSS